MRASLKILTLCLSFATVALPSAAIAALSSPEMDAAKLQALSGKILNLPTSCPSVEIPAVQVKTQAEFDKLDVQLRRTQLCMISMREMAKEPNALELAKTQYPKATPAQVKELADIMLLAARPVLEKHEAILERTETKTHEMASGFMRKKEVEQYIEESYQLCNKEEPKERAWESWVAADIFLTKNSIFVSCLKSLFSKIERIDPTYVVNTHYSDETSTVQTYLLKEIPNIKEAGFKVLDTRLDAAASASRRAKEFSILNRAADAKALKEKEE